MTMFTAANTAGVEQVRTMGAPEGPGQQQPNMRQQDGLGQPDR